jgi:hypothetical protein
MEELVNLFVNNGVAVACVIYFMWYNNNTLKEFTNKFNDLQNQILFLLEKIDIQKNEK